MQDVSDSRQVQRHLAVLCFFLMGHNIIITALVINLANKAFGGEHIDFFGHGDTCGALQRTTRPEEMPDDHHN